MTRFASFIARLDRNLLRTWVLLLALTASLIYGASDIVQGLSVDFLWPLAITALGVGWLLARSRVSGWGATAIVTLAGFGYTFWGIGRLGKPITDFLVELSGFFRQTIQTREFPDIYKVAASFQEIILGLQVLLDRLYLWVFSLFNSVPSYDRVVLVMVWGLATWGALIWASWAIRRMQRPFLSAVPAFLILGYSLAFVGGQTFFLLPMLAVVLSLSMFMNRDDLERKWNWESIEIPQRVWRNISNTAVLVTISLVTVAAFTPSISIEDVNEFIDNLTEDEEPVLAKSIGLKPKPGPGAASESRPRRIGGYRQGLLPRQHLIGSGPELADQVAMVIQATELKPDLNGGGIEEVPISVEGYYWRSLTYDIYDGRNWSTENIEIETFQPGQLSITDALPGQHILRQRVELSDENTGLVHVAGQLITTDQPYSIAWRPKTSPPGTRDLFGATIDSNTFAADSLLQAFSEEDLRNAGQYFPPEIANYYMDLPRNVSDRVIRLAFDLTTTQPTPYDRAVAIESYLRTIEYDLDIPAPPLSIKKGLTDYFIFDLQRGYCDYYSTSMVVLARLSGLPARFVQGYVGGAYDEDNDVYIVTEDLAHSWVEIYFAGYGWVEFEPTAGRPAIERASEPVFTNPEDLEPQVGFLESIEENLPPLVTTGTSYRVIWLVIGAAFVLLLIWRLWDEWRLHFLSPQRVISIVFARLYRQGGYFRVAAQEGKTPHEYADAFFEKFSGLAGRRRNKLVLRTDREVIDWLADQFARFRYGQYLPDHQAKVKAIKGWRRLRPAIYAARWETFRSRFRRI